MSKATKIIAGLGVVAGLGVAALPMASYAETVSGDVQLDVEVQSAIAMQITGNNDAGSPSYSDTYVVAEVETGDSVEGMFELSGNTYVLTEDGTAQEEKTYYQKAAAPTYGPAKAYSPTGATTIDGQSVADFDLGEALETSSTRVAILPNTILYGDASAATPAENNNFGSIITVWTNAPGYTLSVADADADTRLMHTEGIDNIPAAAGAFTQGTAAWNFDTSILSGGTQEAKTAAAMPAAGSAVAIDGLATKTSGGRVAKVDYNVSTSASQSTGVYTDTITYTATTN